MLTQTQNLSITTTKHMVEVGQVITMVSEPGFTALYLTDVTIKGETFDITDEVATLEIHHSETDLPELFIQAIDELVYTFIVARYPDFTAKTPELTHV